MFFLLSLMKTVETTKGIYIVYKPIYKSKYYTYYGIYQNMRSEFIQLSRARISLKSSLI